MAIYKTKQGDTFDIISKKVYGSEKFFVNIIESNPQHIDTVIFSAGTIINIPDIDTVDADTSNTAPWRD